VSSHDQSFWNNVAYAIRSRVPIAEFSLVGGCAIVATFIVTHTMVTAFWYDKSVSLVVSFTSSLVVGVMLAAVYLAHGTESQDESP